MEQSQLLWLLFDNIKTRKWLSMLVNYTYNTIMAYLEVGKKRQNFKNTNFVMGRGIPEPENTRSSLTFLNTRHTQTRHLKIQVYPNPPEPDFFNNREYPSQLVIDVILGSVLALNNNISTYFVRSP